MKRLLFVIVTGIIFNFGVSAQLLNFEQRGSATQEMWADGFSAAHPNLTIGSKILVVNINTGKELEVTIIDRIPPAANRIIDLSFDAWMELDLDENSPVKIYLPPLVRNNNPEDLSSAEVLTG